MTIISVYCNPSVPATEHGEYRLYYNHTTNRFYGSFVASDDEQQRQVKLCAEGGLMAYLPHERGKFALRLDGIELVAQYEV